MFVMKCDLSHLYENQKLSLESFTYDVQHLGIEQYSTPLKRVFCVTILGLKSFYLYLKAKILFNCGLLHETLTFLLSFRAFYV